MIMQISFIPSLTTGVLYKKRMNVQQTFVCLISPLNVVIHGLFIMHASSECCCVLMLFPIKY